MDCVVFHPNSNYIATGSTDRSVRMWDIQTGARIILIFVCFDFFFLFCFVFVFLLLLAVTAADLCSL